MLTINKVFTFPFTLPVREYGIPSGSFQKKLVSSSYKWVPKYILFLPNWREKGRLFLNGKAYTYPMNDLLHVGLMLTIIKVFIILFLLVRIGIILEIFKINQHTLLSIEHLSIFSSWSNWRGEEGLSWRVQEGGHIVRLPPRALGCRKEKSLLSWNLI